MSSPTCVDIGIGPCIPVVGQGSDATFVTRIYGYGLGLLGGVAILALMYGGYVIITSQGDPIQLRRGKNIIKYALLGVILAIFGFVFIQIIGGSVLKIPGFS